MIPLSIRLIALAMSMCSNQMFLTFYQYLQSLLIFTQGEIALDIEDFDKKFEKLVVNLIGKDRVKVWQYFDGWE